MRTGGSKRGSTYNVHLNCEQAVGSRDALAKVLTSNIRHYTAAFLTGLSNKLIPQWQNLQRTSSKRKSYVQEYSIFLDLRFSKCVLTKSRKMDSSSFVLITSMNDFSKFSLSLHLNPNRKSMNAKELNGHQLITLITKSSLI